MKKIVFIGILVLAITKLQAQTKLVLGDYKGEIGLGGNSVSVETSINYNEGKYVTSYSYGPALEQKGSFINCKLENHIFTADWVESADSKGTFKAVFDDDYKNFIAVWYYEGGRYGGGWTGKR